jgi:hypothetical protein
MNTSNKINWVVAAIGVWEIIAPWVLGYNTLMPAVWNAVIVGAVILILAVWSALSNSPTTVRALDWINAILGGWLIIAPFVLGYSTFTVAALWNPIIVGIVVAVLEVWAALSVRAVEVS